MKEDYINSILFYEDRTENRYVNSMKEKEEYWSKTGVNAYQDKGFKGMCLDCGLDIYYQKFDYVNEQCESCKEE
jgi:uncharacterized protein (DUF983 family)